MSSWPSVIPGLVIKSNYGTVRGREYCPEAERYVCCGSRSCWWCERGTVRVSDTFQGATPALLREKMTNPSWWQPAIGPRYLAYLIRRVTKAIDLLEEEDVVPRLPLKLTGERFDSVDAWRVADFAELPFTKDDEEELVLLSILERQERERQ